jgi:tRNA pseudouridine38-40 synthase
MSIEGDNEDSSELQTPDSEPRTKVVLVVEYDGSNYCGFQFQENAPTVQDEIEKALAKLTQEKVRIVTASRTDAGVHAKGQVVGFLTGSSLEAGTFIKGLNYYLPPDIAVKESYKVNKGFNIQRDAISRQYRYLIFNSAARSPLKRGYTDHVRGELNVEAMDRASRKLLGQHDLASFVTCFSESVIKSTFRIVFNAGVERKGTLVIFDIKASSFLPHQVRNTVGTLVRVGLGKINLDDFEMIMEAKKPGLAGPTAPAQGLYLMKVNYPRPFGDYNEDL